MGDVDEDGNIRTRDGLLIPRFEPTAQMMRDKTTVLYGATQTGKTIIIKRIMQMLREDIEQALVFSPQELQNHSYEGIVPSALIHYRVGNDEKNGGLKFLESVWRRQEMAVEMLQRALAPKTLLSLFGRLPRAPKRAALEFLERANETRKRGIRALRRQLGKAEAAERVASLNEKFHELKTLLFRNLITKFYETLWYKDLSEDERYSVVYSSLNPRMLLIFDDCAAELKSVFSKEIFRKLFYQGRHPQLTTLISCQDDTDLAANFRKGAHFTFFTTKQCCSGFFNRASNQLKEEAKYVNRIIDCVFSARHKHRKFVYVRDDPAGHHYYHYTAPKPEPFTFCSEAIHELSREVCTRRGPDRSNEYYDSYRLDSGHPPA